MRLEVVLFPVTLCLLSTGALAQTTAAERSVALKEITVFAEATCIPQGQRTAMEVKSEITGGLNGLLGKMAALQLKADGSFKKETYTGVLQDRIVGVTLDPAGCKMDVLKELKDVFF